MIINQHVSRSGPPNWKKIWSRIPEAQNAEIIQHGLVNSFEAEYSLEAWNKKALASNNSNNIIIIIMIWIFIQELTCNIVIKLDRD